MEKDKEGVNERNWGKTRLMLLGNVGYLVELVKKYGEDVTLKDAIKKELGKEDKDGK